MDIRFFIPSCEKIPTSLRLKVDDIDVIYRRTAIRGLNYVFDVYTMDRETAIEVVEEIISTMEAQSYDHGAQWRAIEKTITEDYPGMHTFFVKFRVRDAG